jgi:NADH pyrophosphatase NudC (nudix superfamily)
MAFSKKRTQQVEEVRPYVEGVAKNLVDKLYGANGPAWGTTLTDIEDLLLDIRQLLTEKMLAESLARQAAAQDQQRATTRICPGCQQPLDYTAAHTHLVQTRAGTVEWSEPEGYCSRCRRAFFPSVQESGDRPE